MAAREIITLEEARHRLGDGVVVCLEPNAVRDAKLAAGKGDELWVFDPETGRSGRGDRKFFDVRYFDRGGYGHLGIFEEPGMKHEGHGPRVIGHVIVETNPRGLVRTRPCKGLNVETIELQPSSATKGELAGGEEVPVGFFEANPQRIGGGLIAVYHRKNVDFPDAIGMEPRAFVVQSTDGRSINALGKCGLL